MLGGVRTKIASQKVRVMLGKIKKKISLARKELMRSTHVHKPMYSIKYDQLSLFPDEGIAVLEVQDGL